MDAVSGILTASFAGSLVTGIVVLVRIAIGAERRRADDWRTAAQTQSAANEVHSANIAKLIGSVEQLAASQREVLALLQAQSAGKRRGAA